MRDPSAPLSNGANLISRQAARPDENVVLAEMPGTPQPFVTWIEDAEGNLFWGHYFETLPEATSDFTQRLKRAA